MSDAMTQAREWLEKTNDQDHGVLFSISARQLAALLTETRTKALEEAAAVCDEFGREAFKFSYDPNGGVAAEILASNIRALKAKGGEK